jgi:hypothetical protein
VKRQREQARRERQAEKAAKRAQRKNDKAQGIETPEEEVVIEESAGEPNP